MVFGNIIGFVIDQGKGFLDVLFYFPVIFLKRSPHIFRIEGGFGGVNIWYPKIGGSELRMVWQTVNHCQTEMCIGAAEQGFAFVRQHFLRRAAFLYGFEGGVGSGYHLVVVLPYVHIALVLRNSHSFPGIILIQELVGVGVLFSGKVHIVRSIFEVPYVSS